ncbi:hypothetical protein FRC12_003074 [Ceratobasidium sp. 428]|nr:hypothetical protein FRC12_003074 [Ceratobasidium sp. 428]
MSLAMSRTTQPQFHRPRRSGRWSPPLWGCYEYQTSGSEHDSECETCSDSDSGSESGERERERESHNSRSEESNSDEDEQEERDRKMREKRKGKQPEGGCVRRKERVREPVYRPILTIRRSEGFVWNQDLFLPSYIRDRYIATSPPSTASIPQPAVPASADSSFSGMDFEIECVDIHVDGNGTLEGLIPPSKKDE